MCVVKVAEETGGGAGWISSGKGGSVVDEHLGAKELIGFEGGLNGEIGGDADAVGFAIFLGGADCIQGD